MKQMVEWRPIQTVPAMKFTGKKRASEEEMEQCGGKGWLPCLLVVVIPDAGTFFLNHMNRGGGGGGGGDRRRIHREILDLKGTRWSSLETTKLHKRSHSVSSSLSWDRLAHPHLSSSCSSCCWPPRRSSLWCRESRSERNRRQSNCLREEKNGMRCNLWSEYANDYILPNCQGVHVWMCPRGGTQSYHRLSLKHIFRFINCKLTICTAP